MARRALITGCTGQDGAYLAEFLLSKGYEVHGLKRRASSFNTERVDQLFATSQSRGGRSPFYLHYGDMTDSTNLIRLVQDVAPNEVYNLAAQSHVHVSFETPEYTANADGLGALRLLEALRILRLHDARFYQASTSELFGNAPAPQSEATPFWPRSPYAAAKLYAHWITVNYREAYGIHASNGILFNHESPLRGETFVTRKITRAVAAQVAGERAPLRLGNLDAQRDWGHARDYVRGMWLMLQQPVPSDYVLATGESRTVRDFVNCAFAEVGLDLRWRGTGIDEVGVDATDRVRVVVDPRYFRPTEVHHLCGDATRAREMLGWAPEIEFTQLVSEMVQSDLGRVGVIP